MGLPFVLLATCFFNILGASQGFTTPPLAPTMNCAARREHRSFCVSMTMPPENKDVEIKSDAVPSAVASSKGDQAATSEKMDSAKSPPISRNVFLVGGGLAGLGAFSWATTPRLSRSEQRKQKREAALALITSEKAAPTETPAEARRRRQSGKAREVNPVLETTVLTVKGVAQGVATAATVVAPIAIKAAEIVGKDVVPQVVDASMPLIQQVPGIENAQAALETTQQSLEGAKIAAEGLVSSSVSTVTMLQDGTNAAVQQALKPAVDLKNTVDSSVMDLKNTVDTSVGSALRPAMDLKSNIDTSAARLTEDTLTLLSPAISTAESAVTTVQDLNKNVQQAVEPAVPALQATLGAASTTISSVQEKGLGGTFLALVTQAGSAVAASLLAAAGTAFSWFKDLSQQAPPQ